MTGCAEPPICWWATDKLNNNSLRSYWTHGRDSFLDCFYCYWKCTTFNGTMSLKLWSGVHRFKFSLESHFTLAIFYTFVTVSSRLPRLPPSWPCCPPGFTVESVERGRGHSSYFGHGGPQGSPPQFRAAGSSRGWQRQPPKEGAAPQRGQSGGPRGSQSQRGQAAAQARGSRSAQGMMSPVVHHQTLISCVNLSYLFYFWFWNSHFYLWLNRLLSWSTAVTFYLNLEFILN